jgi:hypothetical protein
MGAYHDLCHLQEEFSMSVTAVRRSTEHHPDQIIPTTNAPSMSKARTSRPIEAVMHPHVYRIALGIWIVFLAIFWATFWVSANALFMVVISTFYAVMFFGVPYMMLRQTPDRIKVNRSLRVFLQKPFATIDGTIKGYEALLQVILVPACLILGGTVIGLIIHSARSVH